MEFYESIEIKSVNLQLEIIPNPYTKTLAVKACLLYVSTVSFVQSFSVFGNDNVLLKTKQLM